MIQHIVLIEFKPNVSETKISKIFEELHRIENKIEGLLRITSGKSESPEQMERGFMHGFIVEFSDWEGLQRYQDHPDHQALGAKLVANAVSGINGILVFDLPSGIA
ncbi:MAG: Dabb family protein [Sulfitobacter sp.]